MDVHIVHIVHIVHVPQKNKKRICQYLRQSVGIPRIRPAFGLGGLAKVSFHLGHLALRLEKMPG